MSDRPTPALPHLPALGPRLRAAAVGRRLLALSAALLAVAAVAPAAQAGPSGNVAALQVALQAVNTYGGAVDGVSGPMTKRALRRFQRRRHLAVDGVAGPQTRRALGRRGRPRLGSRAMRRGNRGWDVAALQFGMRRRGFSSGAIDGGFGPATEAAVLSLQRSRGLGADGVAGPATLRSLRRGAPRRTSGGGGNGLTGPVAFLRPLNAPISSPFGMRWGRLHAGIDFDAPMGARVGAAGRGVVSFAGHNTAGYGNLVVIDHREGFQSWYAHLSTVTSWRGEVVTGGTRIGYVGSTGYSTGPHLHFEVRLNGTPIDPMTRLLGATAGTAASVAAGAQPRRRPTHRGCDRERLEALGGGARPRAIARC
ncbi:MAG TPA: peptidoglycan-binding protein [Thermoleophilaceae bacterium]|nr:peptidoglycan-binding protein [Thermoleophilaceae bacterium]